MTIQVIGKSHCPKCSSAKLQLEHKNVPFEYINSDGNEELLVKLREQGHMEFPVITFKDNETSETLAGMNALKRVYQIA